MMAYNPTGVDIPPYGLVSLRWNCPHVWDRPVPRRDQIGSNIAATSDGVYTSSTNSGYGKADLKIARPVRTREDGQVALSVFPHPSAVGVDPSFGTTDRLSIRAFGNHGAELAPWLIQNAGEMAVAGPLGIASKQYGEINLDWPLLVRVRASDQSTVKVGDHLGPCPYEWVYYRDKSRNHEAFDAMVTPEGAFVCAGLAESGKLALLSPRLSDKAQPYQILYADDIVPTDNQLTNRWAFPAITNHLTQDGVVSVGDGILRVTDPGIYHVGFTLSARTAVSMTYGGNTAYEDLGDMTVGVYVLADPGETHARAGYYAPNNEAFSTGGGAVTLIHGLWHDGRSGDSLGSRDGNDFLPAGNVSFRYLFPGDRLVLTVKKPQVASEALVSVRGLVWWKHACLWVARVDSTSVMQYEPTSSYQQFISRRLFPQNSMFPYLGWSYSPSIH